MPPFPSPKTNPSDLADFEVQGERAVARILDELVDEKTLIALHHPEDLDLFVVSRIYKRSLQELAFSLNIQVDGEEREGCVARVGKSGLVEMETGPGMHLVTRKLIAVCTHDGVSLQFNVDVTSTDADGNLMFAVLPQSVFRLQRREFFRVRPAPDVQADCVIFTPKGLRRYRIIDISAGGVAIAYPAFESLPEVGRMWDRCRLELEEYSPFDCLLRIRVIKREETETADIVRVGCEFVRPSPFAARAVQTFVDALQRSGGTAF